MKKLLGSESIYSPQKAVKIREYFHNKNIIVMDLDGVLAGGDREPNTKGIFALRSLREAGYSLVLWTRGSNGLKEVDLFIAENDLSSIFDLVICSENYTVGSYNNHEFATIKDFEKVVNSTAWLSLQDKRQILNNIAILTAEFDYFRYKIPELFFKECAVIDNDPDEALLNTQAKLIVPREYLPGYINNIFTEKYVKIIQKIFPKK